MMDPTQSWELQQKVMTHLAKIIIADTADFAGSRIWVDRAEQLKLEGKSLLPRLQHILKMF